MNNFFRSLNSIDFIHGTLFTLALSFMGLLISCSLPCRQWKRSIVTATYPCTTLTKISLEAESSFEGLDAEILSDGTSLTMFLNTTMFSFPMSETDEQNVDIAFETPCQTLQFTTNCLEGRGRIQLPLEATQAVVSTLLNGDFVIVKIGSFQAVLIPGNFKKLYAKLIR